MSRPLRLLFVCTGNICRSPMAAALAEVEGDRIGVDVTARSAGTLGLIDRPADPNAVRACAEVGVDLSGHRSQGISNELLAWADKVVVMELEHANHLRTCYDIPGDKVLLLGPFGGYSEIADPVGGWMWRFRRSRRAITTSLQALLRRLAR